MHQTTGSSSVGLAGVRVGVASMLGLLNVGVPSVLGLLGVGVASVLAVGVASPLGLGVGVGVGVGVGAVVDGIWFKMRPRSAKYHSLTCSSIVDMSADVYYTTFFL